MPVASAVGMQVLSLASPTWRNQYDEHGNGSGGHPKVLRLSGGVCLGVGADERLCHYPGVPSLPDTGAGDKNYDVVTQCSSA